MSHAATRSSTPSGLASPRAQQKLPGISSLDVAIGLTADLSLLVCLGFFVSVFGSYPRPGLDIAAWVILAAVVTLNHLATLRRLWTPSWWPRVAASALLLVVLLDCAGSWVVGGAGTPAFPLAAVGAGAAITTFATQRTTASIVGATAALLVLLFGDLALTGHGYTVSFGPRIVCLGIAALPPLVAAQIVRAFRAMLEFQADLSQAQAATTTPDSGFGLLGSEQLMTLDLRAEQLLDDVATGREPIPLSAESAELAATIATQLRVSLIARKSETWLHHAVADSALVGAIAVVDDPEGNAALLARDQRDGLLTAIWMLAADVPRQPGSLTIAVGRPHGVGSHVQRLAIGIELVGVPKRRVDPAAWQAIAKVGRYTERAEASTLHIAVDCMLDVVADR